MCAQILSLHENDATSADVTYSLEQSGHNVVLAVTFREAISILNSRREIDLVISDVHLENGGNVFDFLRWVKVHTSTVVEIPFVLFSCRPSPIAKHLVDAVRTSARILGAAKYISMDVFDSDDFRKQIDLLLGEAHQSSKIESTAFR